MVSVIRSAAETGSEILSAIVCRTHTGVWLKFTTIGMPPVSVSGGQPSLTSPTSRAHVCWCGFPHHICLSVTSSSSFALFFFYRNTPTPAAKSNRSIASLARPRRASKGQSPDSHTQPHTSHDRACARQAVQQVPCSSAGGVYLHFN